MLLGGPICQGQLWRGVEARPRPAHLGLVPLPSPHPLFDPVSFPTTLRAPRS